MGFCKRRYFLGSVCLLQLLTVIERQVFDFLGFLWIPILVNFFEVVFIIFGIFGACQYRPKYIISYSIWNMLWLGWNIFLICLYMDTGILNHKESKVLKLDPDSGSWWQNGPGCRGTLNTTAPVPTWENVTNCLVDYRHIEVFQAGLQCFLAVLGIITGLCLTKTFMEEDDSFNYLGGDGKGPRHLALQPMYVSCNNVNSGPSLSNLRSNMNSERSVRSDQKLLLSDPCPIVHHPYIRHTTKSGSKLNVKHVHTDLIRYHNPLHNSFDRIGQIRSSNAGDSVENPRPKSLYTNAFTDSLHKTPHKNVKRTSLYSIEFSSQSETRPTDNESIDYNDQLPTAVSPKPMTPRRVKRRSVMTRGSSSRHSSRRYSGARSSTRSTGRAIQNPVTKLLEQQQKVQAYESPTSPSPVDPLPNYCSIASNNNLLAHRSNWQSNGHANPTYQQSSTQSLNEPDDLDDLYNNRPASVRSGYSNFHGTRVISYGAPQHYHSHATPQVPQKKNNPHRQSMRSMVFLNNGPPAYSSQGQASADSETTI